MIRKKAASLNPNAQLIRWRAHEPSRLETFSDAVLAFALTLIIVSIEVPHSFDELFETMKGTISFAACFAILFQIWNSQNIYFRRYGLNDGVTFTLNGMLLFVVLVYAYPLKFLSMLLFGGGHYTENGEEHAMIRAEQVPTLMLIYNIGYTVIYALFYFMYRNALRLGHLLELTAREVFETKTVAGINMLNTCIGLLAVILSLTLPQRMVGLSGFIYFLIPVAYGTWFSYRGKKARTLFPGSAAAVTEAA